MEMNRDKQYNERVFNGHVIGWIREAVNNRQTVFQDATNDMSVKMENGKTLYPDVLLFSDKISGIIFNGWELKFPDVAVDDIVMLDNALQKASKLGSKSFVTWNANETIIWQIQDENYTRESLVRTKYYPGFPEITGRDFLKKEANYRKFEPQLRQRLFDILYDLGQLFEDGTIKPAINISVNIINAVYKAAQIVIPQIREAIIHQKSIDIKFRDNFTKWKIYEQATLKILASSSRRTENMDENEVLAKFTFYNIVGKSLFYLTLCENLKGALQPIRISNAVNLQEELDRYFAAAKAIAYQAIFMPYFTDKLSYSSTTCDTLFKLFEVLTAFDFRVLPQGVIGNILENIVPRNERQKFGQYFTSETLSYLVAFPAVRTVNDLLFDPTSGTGSFLSAFYKILLYLESTSHSEDILTHIWGNDISHFPAILSVINLYKQNVSDKANFPRVTRNDFFNLHVGESIEFPDPNDYTKKIVERIPLFDGIVSNLPFVQQEDIPNDILTPYFREIFQNNQRAFLKDQSFEINERSDYFTYCVYNAYSFLKEGGVMAVVTSNAWLGKAYGFQFKCFLLDNFHVKYVVKSNAEHWFRDSQVSTIYIVLEKGFSEEPTRFVTINFKLEEKFNKEDLNENLRAIEEFYAGIDYCDMPQNMDWSQDPRIHELYTNRTDSTTVCIVPRQKLVDSINSSDNWSMFFISPFLFDHFASVLSVLHPNVVKVGRGERTGANNMFIIDAKDASATGIEDKYLFPIIKGPDEIQKIPFNNQFSHYLFACTDPIDKVEAGAKCWINKFKDTPNSNGKKTIKEACAAHRPYWYSLRPKSFHLITAINPYRRFFFSFSEIAFSIDQRLIAMKVNPGADIELIAALLNSAITFLTLELRGTSRNLGVLDLNSDYLKKLRVLNPTLLSQNQALEIKAAFQPLKKRDIETIDREVLLSDRIHFDRTILRCFGFDESLLDNIYSLLVNSVEDRVSLKDK